MKQIETINDLPEANRNHIDGWLKSMQAAYLDGYNAGLRDARPSLLTEVPENVRAAFINCDSGNYEPRLLAALNAYIAGPSPAAEPEEKPKIVCLCGSTRFWKTFQEKNLELTKEGCIVLSIGAATASDTEHLLQGVITAEDKARFDELHLRKIDLANEVLVLNVGGYIGESTAKEIDYAKRKGKLVFFLEDPTPAAEPTKCPRCSSWRYDCRCPKEAGQAGEMFADAESLARDGQYSAAVFSLIDELRKRGGR